MERTQTSIKKIKKICDIFTAVFSITMLSGLGIHFFGAKGMLHGLAVSLIFLSMSILLIEMIPLLKNLVQTRNEIFELNKREIDLSYLSNNKRTSLIGIFTITSFIALFISYYFEHKIMLGLSTGFVLIGFLMTVMYLLINYMADILKYELSQKDI